MLRGYQVIEITSDGKNCYLAQSEESSLKFKAKYGHYFKHTEFLDVSGFMVNNSFSSSEYALKMVCPAADIALLNKGVNQLLGLSSLTAEVYGWEWNDYDADSGIIYLDRML